MSEMAVWICVKSLIDKVRQNHGVEKPKVAITHKTLKSGESTMKIGWGGGPCLQWQQPHFVS